LVNGVLSVIFGFVVPLRFFDLVLWFLFLYF
jgi:hypothetical protein